MHGWGLQAFIQADSAEVEPFNFNSKQKNKEVTGKQDNKFFYTADRC
jgi:hypothetical protein